MQTTPQTTTAYCAEEDEIDLFELWENLVSEWKTVALTTGIVIALALGYVLKASPVYETKAIVITPYDDQVADLKLLTSLSISSDSIFHEFQNQLTSSDVLESVINNAQYRNTLIQGYHIKKSPDKQVANLLDLLNKKFKITFPDKKKNKDLERFNAIMLQLDLFDPKLALEILNYIVDQANKLTVDKLMKNWQSSLKQQLQAEKNHYILLDQHTNLRLESEIKRLKDNFKVAKQLGIIKPTNPTDYGQNKKNTVIDIALKDSLHGYWLGTKVLNAEIERRTHRESNLPYSKELRDSFAKQKKLEQQLNLLDKIHFQTYAYKQPPIEPLKPIKPKKALILAVAGITGLMLGIFIALIRGAYKRRRLEEAAA